MCNNHDRSFHSLAESISKYSSQCFNPKRSKRGRYMHLQYQVVEIKIILSKPGCAAKFAGLSSYDKTAMYYSVYSVS